MGFLQTSNIYNIPNKEGAIESVFDNVLLIRDFMYKIVEKYIFIYYYK